MTPEPTYEPAWPLDKLTPARDNVRRHRGTIEEAAAIAELVESIKAVGVLQPIVATTTETTVDTGEVMVVAGHRRRAAAEEAGLKYVPVMLHQRMPDASRVEAMMVENLQRSDLTPCEEADAYHRLIKELKVPQRQLAGRVGVSQPQISRRLKLVPLPAKARAAVDTGNIRLEDALDLAGLPADRIETLFKGSTIPSRYDIQRAVNEYDRERDVEKERAALKKAGVAFIDHPADGWDEEAGPVPLAWLAVDRQEHQDEPCHAVIDRGAGFTPVCTEPGRHPAPEENEDQADDDEPGRVPTPEASAERERRLAERAGHEAELERIQAHAEERQAFCRELVGRPCANDDIIALTLEAIFYLSDMPPVSEAAALLGLEIDEDDERYDYYGGPWIAALRSYAARDKAPGSRTTHQALHALALACGESACPSGRSHSRRPEPECQLPMATAYLEHLWAQGFERHELDETWISGESVEVLRARVIRNAQAQCADPGEAEAVAETLRGAGVDALEDALEQFPDPVDEPPAGDRDSAEEQSPGLPVEGNGDVAELPEVTIRKRGRVYVIVCPDCKEEVGRNTTEDLAEQQRRAHLEVVHGAVPAADAAAS